MPEDPLKKTYDVIVVGSGATGGWAAKRFSSMKDEITKRPDIDRYGVHAVDIDERQA